MRAHLCLGALRRSSWPTLQQWAVFGEICIDVSPASAPGSSARLSPHGSLKLSQSTLRALRLAVQKCRTFLALGSALEGEVCWPGG